MKKSTGLRAIDIAAVQSRMLTIRNQQVLLDRDVAALYGVQTKEINQAIRNNPGKFPEGFVFRMNDEEFADWKSKILTSNLSDGEIAGLRMGLRRAPYALTERGLYMLATILKGDIATRATLAIVNTYAQVRSMVRDMEAIQTDSEHFGSSELAAAISKKRPRFVFCGHIHTGQHGGEDFGTSRIYNVSRLDERYDIAYEPTWVDV